MHVWYWTCGSGYICISFYHLLDSVDEQKGKCVNHQLSIYLCSIFQYVCLDMVWLSIVSSWVCHRITRLQLLYCAVTFNTDVWSTSLKRLTLGMAIICHKSAVRSPPLGVHNMGRLNVSVVGGLSFATDYSADALGDGISISAIPSFSECRLLCIAAMLSQSDFPPESAGWQGVLILFIKIPESSHTALHFILVIQWHFRVLQAS